MRTKIRRSQEEWDKRKKEIGGNFEMDDEEEDAIYMT